MRKTGQTFLLKGNFILVSVDPDIGDIDGQ